MQNLIIILTISVALLYVGKRLYNAYRSGGTTCSCSSGCSGCSSTCTRPQPQNKNLKNPEDNRS